MTWENKQLNWLTTHCSLIAKVRDSEINVSQCRVRVRVLKIWTARPLPTIQAYITWAVCIQFAVLPYMRVPSHLAQISGRR